MKKLCALLLSLALMLSATALAGVYPSAEKTAVNAGEYVYVKVQLDSTLTNVYGLEYHLYFNPTLFEYDKAASTVGDVNSRVKVSDSVVADGDRSYVLVQYTNLDRDEINFTAGTLYTVAFKAKADIAASANAGFELKHEMAKNLSRVEYDSEIAGVPSDKAELNVSVQPAPTAVESVTLNQETATIKLGGDTLTLTATVLPENAADKNVTWISDNEAVATVDGGVVTAVAIGTAKITATAGGKSASCTVKVEAGASSGYTVKLTAGESVNVGEGVKVAVLVGVGDEDTRTTYNAVDIVLNYDAEKLSYSGDAKIGDVTIVNDAATGTLRLTRYGAALDLGQLVELPFTAKASGNAKVEFTSAKVDESQNAVSKDAPDAKPLNDVTVSITGYRVNLGENFTGNAYTTPGADYTFTAKDSAHYDYSNVKATIGETDVSVTDNGDGTYTIAAADITGDITITATVTGKQYSVTITGDDTSGAATANYGTDYTFTISKQSGYKYAINANVPYIDNNDGTYTIAGSEITKDITITVTKTAETPTPPSPTTTTITITGVTEDEVQGGLTHTATNGVDYKLTLNKDAAYDYILKLDGTVIEANEDGTYTIPGDKINGTALNISIEKNVAQPDVEVVEYLKLSQTEGEVKGKSMWLVLVSGKPVDGNVYTYDGNIMFTSEKYSGARCYLMISDQTGEEVKAAAAEKVSQKAGTADAVNYNGDVNRTNVTDVNDAQLVYDMYNAKYVDFTENLTVEGFLRADMNGSKNITVEDAAAIVAKIHTASAPSEGE